MRRHKDPRIRVGRYTMFSNTMRVYYDPLDESGRAVFGWSDEGFISITLGGRGCGWSELVGTMLHELLEVALRLNNNCLEPVTGLARHDTGRFRFHLDHDQFTAVCREVGDVAAFLQPDLYRTWKKHGKGAA